MKICLITKLNKPGTVDGVIPSIQSLEYWFNQGYKHITHATDIAITLSKIDIGLTGEHCSYSKNTFKK